MQIIWIFLLITKRILRVSEFLSTEEKNSQIAVEIHDIRTPQSKNYPKHVQNSLEITKDFRVHLNTSNYLGEKRR